MIEEEDWSKELEANRKPGQKHPTPSPGFADRVFYESLLQQRPDSHMAQKWCIEYGVLKWAEAEALCLKMGVVNNVKRPGKSPKLKKPKGAAAGVLKALDESTAAEDMEITGSGFEGVGLGSLYDWSCDVADAWMKVDDHTGGSREWLTVRNGHE